MRKIYFILASLVILALAAAGCGGGADKKQDAKPAQKTEQKATKLKVGATPVPHAEVLNAIKPLLAKEGIELTVVEFSDYVQPNLATNDKELDANYFQHLPYLENFTKEHQNVKLVSAAGIHIEPMGVYSRKVKKLDELETGASVAIPNDPTNGGRALLLLQRAGVIKLKKTAVDVTVQDIIDNPKELKIQELEAAQVPRSLDDVDAAVINTNFAMQANLVPTKDAIVIEDGSSPYVNIVAVRAGDEKRPEIVALCKALQSQDAKKFFQDKYKGAVVPTF